jgi:endonuclease/exonuclease/phosphatase family metal-dependent hydrolase
VLRVGSFNIRFDDEGDREWLWRFRADRVIRTILAEAPDIIGLQEVTTWDGPELLASRQLPILEAWLPEYGFAGARPLDSIASSNPILYRRDRFQLLETGVFFFSDDPETHPQTTWELFNARFARWARFRRLPDGGEVFVLNAHYSPVRGGNRRRATELILEYAPMYAQGAPVIVVGDLNAFPGWTSVRRLREGLALTDAHAGEERGTLHRGRERYGWGRVDYVLVGREFTVVDSWISDYRPGGEFPSDHLPVFADVTLRHSGALGHHPALPE